MGSRKNPLTQQRPLGRGLPLPALLSLLYNGRVEGGWPRAQTLGNRTETIRWGSHFDSLISVCFSCFPCLLERLLPLLICPPEDLKEDLLDHGIAGWKLPCDVRAKTHTPSHSQCSSPYSPLPHPTDSTHFFVVSQRAQVFSCHRAFACAVPASWDTLPAFSRVAPSHLSGLGSNITFQERPPCPLRKPGHVRPWDSATAPICDSMTLCAI